jgi:hypothetical protein
LLSPVCSFWIVPRWVNHVKPTVLPINHH